MMTSGDFGFDSGPWWPKPAEPASAAQSRGTELSYFDGSTGASSSNDFGACDAALRSGAGCCGRHDLRELVLEVDGGHARDLGSRHHLAIRGGHVERVGRVE